MCSLSDLSSPEIFPPVQEQLVRDEEELKRKRISLTIVPDHPYLHSKYAPTRTSDVAPDPVDAADRRAVAARYW